MGKANPVYKDPNSKVCFTRRYEGKKRIMAGYAVLDIEKGSTCLETHATHSGCKADGEPIDLSDD